MIDPTPSLYDSNEYYGANPQGSRLSPSLDGLLSVVERYKVRAVMKGTGLTRGKVLDVGAGDGKFLKLLQDRGFSVVGTTASSISAKAALAQFGIQLEVTETLDVPQAAGPYDLVTYWHVFEHLADPVSHTARWNALLKKGGFLILEVPNIKSVGARLCYRSWLGSDSIHHINHQAPQAILDTLIQSGFEPLRTEYFSAKFSYVFLWSALLGRLFGPSYDFEGIMGLLKGPVRQLLTRPFWTLNACAALIYLAPVIGALIAYGSAFDRGEVFRVFGQKIQ